MKTIQKSSTINLGDGLQNQVVGDKNSDAVQNRIEWLLFNRIPGFVESLKQRENKILTVKKAMETIVAADPSANHSAVQWLINCYQKDGYLYEDLVGGSKSKVYETLVWFNQSKKSLSVDQRSLYQYKSLADLYRVIKIYVNKDQSNFIGFQTKKSEKNKDAQRARQESIILYENQEQKIKFIIPQSKFAAQWWSKGTRWCTGSESNNMFDMYNNKSPLIICTFWDKDSNYQKVQMWSNNRSFSIMDESDKKISVNFVKDNWFTFEPLIRFALKTNTEALEYFPRDKITKNILRSLFVKAISMSEELVYLKEYKEQRILSILNTMYSVDYRKIKKLLKMNDTILESIPKKYIDSELLHDAVKENAQALKYIPERSITLKLVQTALKQQPDLWPVIPDRFKTKELAIENFQRFKGMIEHIKPEHITLDMCEQAVQASGDNYQFLPEHFKNIKLTQLALDYKNKAEKLLKFVPQEILTQEICNQAVQQDPYNLKFVPLNFKTYSICKQAVEQNGFLIVHVPQEHLDQTICLLACGNSLTGKGNTEALDYLPTYKRTKEFYIQAITNNYYAIKNVPQEYTNVQLYKIAVQQNKNIIKLIPSYLESQVLSLIDENTVKSDKDENLDLNLHPFFNTQTKPFVRTQTIWECESIISLFNQALSESEITKTQFQSNDEIKFKI